MEKKIEKKKIIKSTLLNIDSSYRTIDPKHIYSSTQALLPLNPIKTTKDSNLIQINYPNHNLNIGDRIIIQNVAGSSKILANSLLLFTNFNYLIIDYQNHNISTNYKSYVDNIYIDIELYGSTNIPMMINNIPLNCLLGLKTIKLAFEINDMPSYVTSYFTKYSTLDSMNQNLLFIQLPFQYSQTGSNYLILNQIFQITFNSIAGIEIGYINSNYPINNYNYQSFQEVAIIIDNNNFYIKLNIVPFITTSGGGNTVQIMSIINTITGYPYANNYTILLKKSFNNVTNIELMSTEFSYVDLIIKKDVNNKLYWRNLEDGTHIYSIGIDEGTYTSTSLLNKIQTTLNTTERITSTPEYIVHNIFNITFDPTTQNVQFTAYKKTPLPSSLSVSDLIVNDTPYYLLTVIHPNNFVSVGDTITISNAGDTTITRIVTNGAVQIFSIAASYINTNLTVYSTDSISSSYTALLGVKDQIVTNLVGAESRGGQNTTVQSNTQVSLLFNKNDTIGNILGFKNVGETFAVTSFQVTVSNNDQYVNTNNFNSVGDIVATKSLINLSGNYNYMLMYLNDIEFVYSNNPSIAACFAKILLSGNPGDVLFNTFVKQPPDIYSQSFPINTLNDISVSFLFPDGKIPDFRNINHSFTLKITEEIIQASDTKLNSNNILYSDEMMKLTSEARV